MGIDRARKGGRRQNTRETFRQVSASVASKFACVPKRLIHLANSILDTSNRMRKFLPQGSVALKQIDGLLSILGGCDKWYDSSEKAEEELPKIEDLFISDAWKLKGLLIMSFAPMFMTGSTKVRGDEPATGEVVSKKGKKPKKEPKKEKSKMDILLEEVVNQGLSPTGTVACVLEIPRGKGGGMKGNQARFMADLQATLDLICNKEPFSMVLSGDNKVLI